jgi:UDP-glucose:(heptosyl)LPS alpha-1,3-glucosyltransferase
LQSSLELRRIRLSMKIAITHTRYTRIGGVEGYIRDLVQRLLDAGHEVHYFAQWWDKDADSRIQFHKIPNPWKPIRFLKVRSYDRAVTSMVRLEDFDVVHGFSKSSRQDVYTDGSGTLEDYQTYSLDATSSPLSRALKKISPHQREVAAIERRRFTRGNFKKIVAMSRLAADQIQRRYGLSNEEVEVVYNGIDLSRFKPEKGPDAAEFRKQLGIKDDELVCLLVGNDYRRKGVDTVIEAAALLFHDASFTRKFRFVVVGKERHSREQELIRKSRDLGVTDVVKLHGPMNRIERFFGAADMFVLPTRFDIFGQVVLEALASGVPPIVSAAAGASECLKDGETGFILSDSRDAKALAERVRRLGEDPSLLKRMSARAVESAKDYSWDRHFKRVLEIYDEVARAKKRQPVAV